MRGASHMIKVTLGDTVKDTVSGFEGIAVSRHLYLSGCERITVQPKYNKKDQKLPETETFDILQIQILKSKTVPQGSKKTGGPEKYSDKGR